MLHRICLHQEIPLPLSFGHFPMTLFTEDWSSCSYSIFLFTFRSLYFVLSALPSWAFRSMLPYHPLCKLSMISKMILPHKHKIPTIYISTKSTRN